MKKILGIWIAILLCVPFAKGQRYLKQVFPASNLTSNIQYGSNTNYIGSTQNLFLDFYEPQGDTALKRPLILYVHGGGFVDTNQSKALIHIKAFADSMARRGYAVACINYRLDTSISNRAVINAMHDAKAAVRFFRANANQYKINTDFIFIGGESAGAVTALTATYIDNLSEVSFPTTLPLATDNSVDGNSGNPGFSSDIKAALCLCGGTKTILNEQLFDTAAITTGDQPILLVHGTNDQLIHVAQSLEVAQRATNLNIPNLFYTMPGAGHCPWYFPLQNSWNYLDTIIDYTVPFLFACIQGGTSTNNYTAPKALNIYPNPTKSEFTISINNPTSSKSRLLVYNTLGICIAAKEIILENGQAKINLTNYSPGFYYIKYFSGLDLYTGSVLLR